MAHQQEEGWPLGLQPLNVRIGLGRTREYLGSMSFNTILTSSPISSTDSSSDLDTESTGSFFHDRSITLGSLIGVSSILELSRRSLRGRRPEEPSKHKKPCKSRTWFFSLCSRDSTDVKDANNTPSLGQFLAVERRAATDECRRNRNPSAYVPDEIPLAQPNGEENSLFVNGCIAPPQSSSWSGSEAGTSGNRGLDDANGYGVPVLFSCMCGQASH